MSGSIVTVQVCIDADPSRKPSVALSHRVRVTDRRAIRRWREHEPVAPDLRVDKRGALVAERAVYAQDLDHLGVERHAPVLVGLGVLLPTLASGLADARPKIATALSRSSYDQRSPQTSPRRAPVVMANRMNVPQSGSFHASLRIAAASAGVGDEGLGRGVDGGSSARLD
ncbi:MAG: hypothetical protein ACRDRK_27265 [Pseudonocardia sp.]